MKLDASFAREIKKTANGDRSREAKFAFLNPAKAAAREMSTTKIRENFDSVLKAYGRVVVGVCVAATVVERWDRLDASTVQWGREVLKLWTNRPLDLGCVIINDGLHPTRIEEYAGSFMRLTAEEI